MRRIPTPAPVCSTVIANVTGGGEDSQAGGIGPLQDVVFLGTVDGWSGTTAAGTYWLENQADASDIRYFYTPYSKGEGGKRSVRVDVNMDEAHPDARAGLLYGYRECHWRRPGSPDHLSVAKSLNNLAALYDTQGQYEQARPLYKRALAIKEMALGPGHPSVATSLNNLAVLYYTQNQYAQAEPLYKRALAIREKALEPDHPFLATSLENLALLYRATKREGEAEKLEQKANRIRATHQ